MFLEQCVWAKVFKIDCRLDKGCVYKREVEGFFAGSLTTLPAWGGTRYLLCIVRDDLSKQMFRDTRCFYVTKLRNFKINFAILLICSRERM